MLTGRFMLTRSDKITLIGAPECVSESINLFLSVCAGAIFKSSVHFDILGGTDFNFGV